MRFRVRPPVRRSQCRECLQDRISSNNNPAHLISFLSHNKHETRRLMFVEAPQSELVGW
jgi:hypothetical protein